MKREAQKEEEAIGEGALARPQCGVGRAGLGGESKDRWTLWRQREEESKVQEKKKRKEAKDSSAHPRGAGGRADPGGEVKKGTWGVSWLPGRLKWCGRPMRLASALRRRPMVLHFILIWQKNRKLHYWH